MCALALAAPGAIVAKGGQRDGTAATPTLLCHAWLLRFKLGVRGDAYFRSKLFLQHA